LLSKGEVRWALTDNLGTVRDVVEYDDATDTTSVAEHFTYEAFGAVTSGDASVIRHTYTAQAFDADTGLFYYDKRWYRPETGRFLTPDPIEDDPSNDYRYVGNSPTNATDPSGLAHLPADERGTWIAGKKGDGVFEYGDTPANRARNMEGKRIRYKNDYIAPGGFPAEDYWKGDPDLARVEIDEVVDGDTIDFGKADHAMREKLDDPGWKRAIAQN